LTFQIGGRFGQTRERNGGRNCFDTAKNRVKTDTAIALPKRFQTIPKSGTAKNRAKMAFLLAKNGVVLLLLYRRKTNLGMVIIGSKKLHYQAAIF